MQHRILDAYRAIALVMPNAQIKQRIADVQTQIKNVQENYSSQDEGHFKTPESDRQAIQMLQLAKKMRAVLRVEHNKGKIDPQGFAQEDRRLELMQLKINIANLLKRAMDAQIQGSTAPAVSSTPRGWGAGQCLRQGSLPAGAGRGHAPGDAAAGRTPAAAQREGAAEHQGQRGGRTGRPVPTEEEMVIMSHPLDSTLGPMAPFVCQLLTEMQAVMGVRFPVVDHLCYRAATLPEYLDLKEALAAHGVLLVEG